MKYPGFVFAFTLATAIASSIASAQTVYAPGAVGASLNGFVGIGTASPLGTGLTVTGSTPNIFIQDTAASGQTYYMSSRWGGYFTLFNTSSTTPFLSFNPNGNLGIGVTVPGFKLDVVNDNYNAIRATGASTNSIGIYVQNTVPGGRQFAMLSSGGGPAPVGSFAIWDDSGGGARLTISPSGNVGIGATSPAAKLDVKSSAAGTTVFNATNSTNGKLYELKEGGLGNAYLSAYTVSGVENVRLNTNGDSWFNGGSVGIGTANPGANKLAVNGTIRAKEVIVDSGWSDYVFADDYALAPLSDVEAHIKAEKHLPGIPSAAEVAEHGISVGEMQAKLLAKIEELTLYVIDLKKENAALKASVAEIKDTRSSSSQ